MYQLDFTLKGLPPTTNSHGRQHWSIKARAARQWRALVVLAVGSARPVKALKHAKLELTRCSAVAPDHSAIVEGFKHIIDGLIDAGVIEDDKLANIGFPTYKWEQCSKNDGHIKVKLIELDLESA